MIQNHPPFRQALALLFMFAVGVSMIVNGCGTLLQVVR